MRAASQISHVAHISVSLQAASKARIGEPQKAEDRLAMVVLASDPLTLG